MRATDFRLTKSLGVFACLVLLVWVQACTDPGSVEPAPKGDLEDIPYNPQAYTIAKPSFFPEIPIPADNPMTVEGVQLGRRLFYDPILSGDSTMSCASCHLAGAGFTDNLAVSTGIDNIAGRRSSMSLLNVAYVTKGLFWDGRSPTLEAQALAPVEDPIELHHSWVTVVEKFKRHPDYPQRFRKAFGIKDRSEITKELAAKAIAQFERILISGGNSKYDRYKFYNEEEALDDEEWEGMVMFFDDASNYPGVNLPDAQCFHCHGGVTLTFGTNYFNNGLDSVASLDDFADLGRYEATGNPSDKGKFRAPMLRNVSHTWPYMHDGRFKTLREVLDHYSSNGKGVSNEEPVVRQVGFPIGNGQYSGLTESQKTAIIKFLLALTDTTYMQNPDILNPFQ